MGSRNEIVSQTNVITLHSEGGPKCMNHHDQYRNDRLTALITKLPT